MRVMMSLGILVVVLLLIPAVEAATINIVNGDSAGEGFNDPTTVAPVTGNPGTTLGAQRLIAFRAAADYWGGILQSNVTINVEAQMNSLDCGVSWAVLGSAGTQTIHRDFSGAPLTATWYPQALANSLAGSDLNAAANDIGAQFNSDVDSDPSCLSGVTWWYGVGGTAPGSTIDFYETVLHEIAHGLGFSTFVSESGVKFLGYNDAFMVHLEDHSTGKLWPSMTIAERASSSIDNGDLHWTGANAIAVSGVLSAGMSGGHIRMYAPNPYEDGSSVSHWDEVLEPDELMEPYDDPETIDDLTIGLFSDIGWSTDLIFSDGFESGNTTAWSSTVS